MSTKRLKDKLSKLDRRLTDLRMTVYPNQTWQRQETIKLDAERKRVRIEVKKYTGRGVGGSARRGTPRSVGSSPTAPTIQPESKP